MYEQGLAVVFAEEPDEIKAANPVSCTSITLHPIYLLVQHSLQRLGRLFALHTTSSSRRTPTPSNPSFRPSLFLSPVSQAISPLLISIVVRFCFSDATSHLIRILHNSHWVSDWATSYTTMPPFTVFCNSITYLSHTYIAFFYISSFSACDRQYSLECVCGTK